MIYVAAVALIAAPWLSAVSASAISLRIARSAPSQTPHQQSLLFSDLDGDSQLDKVELFANGDHRDVQITLSSLGLTRFGFETSAPDRGRLLSADLDHDTDLDLVWTSRVCPQTTIVWLGDGKGNFERAAAESYATEIHMLVGSSSDSGLTPWQQESDSVYDISSFHCFDIDLSHRPAIGFLTSCVTPYDELITIAAIFLSGLAERGPPSPTPTIS